MSTPTPEIGQMSAEPEKMKIIVDSLRNNRDVVLLGGREETYLRTGEWPEASGYWSRTLDLFVHPTEPLYTAAELNEFMLGLVPELQPTTHDKFFDYRNLDLGKLYYDESLGKAALTATVTIKENFSVVEQGTLEHTWTAERSFDLKQRTWVRVFPNEAHAIDAAAGINEYTIPDEQLGKTRSDSTASFSLFNSSITGEVITIDPNA